METATALLEGYGYWLLLAAGFAEFAGLPIASVPILIVAGAAAADGALSLPLAALAAATGGLAADAGWYSLCRWRGQRLVDTVCNLTSNPRACVVTVRQRIERIGPIYILPSKFLPGTGNLIAASAGLARVAPRTFALADTAALLLWGGVYASLGFLFTAEVTGIVEWISGFASIAAGVAVFLVLGAGGWRVVRARMHAGGHEAARVAAANDALHDVAGPVHDPPTMQPRTT